MVDFKLLYYKVTIEHNLSYQCGTETDEIRRRIQRIYHLSREELEMQLIDIIFLLKLTGSIVHLLPVETQGISVIVK